MDIELLAIPDSCIVYSPVIASGELVSTYLISDSIVYSPIIAHGDISGEVVLTVTDLTGSSTFFLPSFSFDQLVDFTEFDTLSFFLPRLVSSGQIVMDGVFDGLTVYEPEITQGAAAINTVCSDFLFMFRPLLRQDKLAPVKFRFAESIRGGAPTADNLSTLQEYRSVVSGSNYDSKSDFSFSHITGLIPNYIPVVDAMASKTYYRGIYITNPVDSSPRTNVEFWVNGGESYRIVTDDINKVVQESEHLLAQDEAVYGVSLENSEYFKLSGKDRTSLYGQLEVSYLVSQTPLLYPFNDEGVGIGINLSQATFINGNTRTFLPNLSPGQSVGIYLKVTTKFSPDFPIPKDYAFMHLEYVSTITGMREKYPGQLKVNNSPVGILLPSLSVITETNYAGINPYLSDEVDRFYNRYPPYFLHYEDA